MSTNGHGRRDIDAVLITALAAGATYQEAGDSAGVSKTTVSRRMANQEFRKAVGEQRLELVEALRGRLLPAAPRAVATLSERMEPGQGGSVRLGAARALLDTSLGRRRGFDLFERREVEGVIRDIVEVAARRLPEEALFPFLREIEALAGAR